MAAILKASARKIDIVARYGGEEFALVLEGTDRKGARQLAERIRQEVGSQTHDSAKGTFRATMSLGVAVYPEDGKSKQELIEIGRAQDEPPPARAAAGQGATRMLAFAVPVPELHPARRPPGSPGVEGGWQQASESLLN